MNVEARSQAAQKMRPVVDFGGTPPPPECELVLSFYMNSQFFSEIRRFSTCNKPASSEIGWCKEVYNLLMRDMELDDAKPLQTDRR